MNRGTTSLFVFLLKINLITDLHTHTHTHTHTHRKYMYSLTHAQPSKGNNYRLFWRSKIFAALNFIEMLTIILKMAGGS